MIDLADLIHVRDREGVVHLADESPLGGFVVGCGSWEWMTVIAPEPRGEVCGDCLEFWQPTTEDTCPAR